MKSERIQTVIRLSPELLYKNTGVAKKNRRSPNAQHEQLAQNCVDDYEKEQGEIPFDLEKTAIE